MTDKTNCVHVYMQVSLCVYTVYYIWNINILEPAGGASFACFLIKPIDIS